MRCRFGRPLSSPGKRLSNYRRLLTQYSSPVHLVRNETWVSDQEPVTTFKAQGGVECRFCSRQQPERIMALSLIPALCLLIYRLAEHRLRQRLVRRRNTPTRSSHQ